MSELINMNAMWINLPEACLNRRQTIKLFNSSAYHFISPLPFSISSNSPTFKIATDSLHSKYPVLWLCKQGI